MISDARFYVAGGTLPTGATSYVSRQADVDLLEGLAAGDFCYVLNTRQMGKSSLMVHTAVHLRERGATVLALDLTGIGQNVTAEQWYDGLLNQMGCDLGIEDEMDDYRHAHLHLGPLQRWMSALWNVALPCCPGQLVIFVDEIDVVRSLPFSTDEFFAGIRECYNMRAEKPELRRLTFCLLGVATPASLIRNTQVTPFNIGRRIDVQDFTEAEAAPLTGGLNRNGDRPDSETSRMLGRILYWTGGHPYLTQRLCEATAAALPSASEPERQSASALVDRVCHAIFLAPGARDRDDNLLFVRDRIVRGDADIVATLDLYAQVRAGRSMRSDDLRPTVATLMLSGVVRAEGNCLRVRNRIYERVFDARWIRDHMPDGEVRRQRIAYRRGIARATAVSSTIMVIMAALILLAIRATRRADDNARNAQALSRSLKAIVAERDKALAAKTMAARDKAAESLRADREAARARAKAEQATVLGGQAVAQKRTALAKTAESRERLEALTVAYGTRLQDEGDLSGSLLWIARAARLSSADPLQRAANRVRAAATLRQAPRLVHMWFDVRSAEFSPVDRRVVTVNTDGTATLWSEQSGLALTRPLRPAERITRAIFSPDGRRVLTIGGRSAQMWDAATGLAIWKRIQFASPVSHASFNADGHRFLTVAGIGSVYDIVQVWDSDTGTLLHKLERRHLYIDRATFIPGGNQVLLTGNPSPWIWDSGAGSSQLRAIEAPGWVADHSVSADGHRIVIGLRSGAITVLDAATGAAIAAMSHRDTVTHTCFSPDGTRIATSSGDNTAQVFDAATGARVTPRLQHNSAVYHICFSPDGRYVATASADLTARVWDAATGEPITPPLWHSGYVKTTEFNSDGTRLLTVDGSGIARLWDTAGTELPDRFTGEYSNVSCAAFSPTGGRLATGDFDWAARIWDVATGRPIGPALPHGAAVRDIVFSPDGKRVATACDDHYARIWNAASGSQLVAAQHGDVVSRVAFNRDGRLLLTTSVSVAAVWDTATGRKLCSLRGHVGVVNGSAFSPDGRRVVTAGSDHTARVWDASTGRALLNLPHEGVVTSASFSPDGRLVLTSSSDGRVRLWDAQSGRPTRQPIQQENVVVSALFSPDGRRIVTTNTGSGAARVLQAATGEEIGLPMLHRGTVRFAEFSRDGRFVVTGGEDRTARVWDTATGEAVTPPLRHQSYVRHASFSPTDDCVITICDDGIARLWPLPPDKHSARDLTELAELLCARRMNSRGGTTTMDQNAVRSAWNAMSPALRRSYGPSRDQSRAWHVSMAEADMAGSRWEGALRHFNAILGADPADRQIRALRAYALSQLGRWPEVAAENARMSGADGNLIVLDAHRQVRKTAASEKWLDIRHTQCTRNLACTSDNTVLVMLPGPGRRFTGKIENASQDPSDSAVTMSVLIGSRVAFQSAGLGIKQTGSPVSVKLDGATAFVLRTRHTGPDAIGAWTEACVELMDGRKIWLSDLPIRTIGGL